MTPPRRPPLLLLALALAAASARAESRAPAPGTAQRDPAPVATATPPLPAPRDPAPIGAAPASIVAPAPSSALPPRPVIDRIAFAKLYAGVITAEGVDDGGHGGAVHGQAICKCGIDSIWWVLTHHADFAQFVPRVTSEEVSRRTDHGERAVQTIDATIATVKYALDYSWDIATRHVEFHLVEDLPHDLKAVRGAWQLWPVEHGAATLIDYVSAVDTGRQIPGFIRDYLADQGVKNTLDAVRKRAEERESKH